MAWTGEKSLRFVTLRSSRLTRHAQIGCALVQRRLPARRRGLPQDGTGQRTAHWQPCQCERCSAQGISHQDLAVAGGEMSIHMRELCVQINVIFTFRYTETSTVATEREGHSGHERKQQRQRHHYHRMGVLAMGVCAPGTLQTSASHASQLQSRTSRFTAAYLNLAPPPLPACFLSSFSFISRSCSISYIAVQTATIPATTPALSCEQWRRRCPPSGPL